jgi:hypothetical protein
MPTPPDPRIPYLLLALVAGLGWRVVLRDPSGLELGELVHGDHARHLIVVAGPGQGTAEWALVEEVPRGFAAHLMTRATFDTLRAGTPGPLRALRISGAHVAELDAGCAA